MRLIAILLTVISLTSYGQRVCDLEVHLLLPDSGNKFLSPEPNTIDIMIVNRGPDVLTSRDVLGVGLWVQGYHLVLQVSDIQDTVNVNDTIFLTQEANFRYRVSVEGIKLCVNRCVAWTTEGTVDTLVLEREGDSSYHNNTDCVTGDVKYTLSTNKPLSKIVQSTLYPNPTQGKVFFNENLSNRLYSIIGIHGKTIDSGVITDSNSISLAHLANGIYVINVFRKNGSTVQIKCVKSN
jgi:hypothetical protein